MKNVTIFLNKKRNKAKNYIAGYKKLCSHVDGLIFHFFFFFRK